MYELFLFIALFVGIIGGFVIWRYSNGKQKGLLRIWRKQRGK